MYKLVNDPITNQESNIIIRISDNLGIPKDTENRHYQEYLEWVAEGNTPEEAE
jgi:hypothetical protein